MLVLRTLLHWSPGFVSVDFEIWCLFDSACFFAFMGWKGRWLRRSDGLGICWQGDTLRTNRDLEWLLRELI